MPFDIWKREGVLPVLLGLLALAAASYYFLFAPELRTVRGLKEEIARKEAEVADTMALRTAVEESRGDGGKSWYLRLRSWEERIPVSPEPHRLLSEIGELAARHRLESFGLSVVPRDPGGDPPQAAPEAGAPAKKERMPEVRYRMTFRSTYRDLAGFLDDIPRMRRLLSVRSVSIRGEEGAMVATVDVSAWHRGTR